MLEDGAVRAGRDPAARDPAGQLLLEAGEKAFICQRMLPVKLKNRRIFF
jgi:hypothetical protein